MNEGTNVQTASSGVPDPLVEGSTTFDNRDDEDWEIVEIENALPEQSHTASNSTQAFTWHCKFPLQNAPKSSNLKDYGSENSSGSNITISVHKQHQSRLFNLPVELRLRIYSQVLSIASPTVQLKWHPASSLKKLQPSVLVILETCRKIYLEAEPIFYSINHFLYPIETPRHATSFCKALNPNRRHAIRSLTIFASSGSKALIILKELALLSKLQKLRIERQQSIRYIDINSWVLLAKRLKTELESLGELRELEIVTPETVAPTQVEENRMRRLDQVDALLQEAVSKSGLANI